MDLLLIRLPKRRCELNYEVFLSLQRQKKMQWKTLQVSSCMQGRGQRRTTIRRKTADAKPKSARSEDVPVTDQTESAALRDLTDEVKLNQPDFLSPAPQQLHISKTQWKHKTHISAVNVKCYTWCLSIEMQKKKIKRRSNFSPPIFSFKSWGRPLKKIYQSGRKGAETLRWAPCSFCLSFPSYSSNLFSLWYSESTSVVTECYKCALMHWVISQRCQNESQVKMGTTQPYIFYDL